MNVKFLFTIMSLSFLVVATNAIAEDDELEATMRVMENPDGELPDAVINGIPLPNFPDADRLPDQAEGKSDDGLATAETMRGEGVQNAIDAFENAAQLASDAQDNAESSSRANEAVDPPTPPDVPPPPPGGGG